MISASTSTTEPHGGDQHPDPTTEECRDPGGKHPFKVTVRTLAGHTRADTVKPTDTVAEVTDDTVGYFVRRGELTDGSYALTLPRTGSEADLDPTATLREAGVVEGDVLVLVNRRPQVDG